jgi:hypothetical protein
VANSAGPPGVPLVSEHATWISVDPIAGCPANCRYCYLGPLGLRGQRPVPRVSPGELVTAVEAYLTERSQADPYGRLSHTPICFGNYTDTFMSRANIAYFHEYARLHAARFGSHPLCVVTKSRLSFDDLHALDQLDHTIIIFMSQSFLGRFGTPQIERGPVCRPADTLRNIGLFAPLRNVKPVHFLRPVTSRSVPSLPRALEILGQLQEAGCLATVAIGLKVGSGIELSSDDLAELLGDRRLTGLASTEIFPDSARRYVLQAADALEYPVYFHTSCAVALATGTAEALGTWREPVRQTLCLPCRCPSDQRSRCDGVRSRQSAPSPAELSGLCTPYGMPGGSLSWSPVDSAIRLGQPVSQYTYNRLVHALPYRVIGGIVERDLAWPGTVEADETWRGPFAGGTKLSSNLDRGNPEVVPGFESSVFGPAMYAAVERLKAITGFVTTLHKASDPRPLAFARYYHVRRVVWATEWLHSRRVSGSEQLDISVVRWLAWAHDLNRWPFAHNSEKGFFDQAGDASRYVVAAGLQFPPPHPSDRTDRAEREARLLSDLEGVISKDLATLSPEGRLVLLADIISGFVEDPLLAVTGLDLSPRLIPDLVRETLAFPLNDEDFLTELKALNLLLYHARDVPNFMRSFDVIFKGAVQAFADQYHLGETDPLTENWFGELRNALKVNFLRKVLFPYNNEKVSHGSVLKAELVQPLLAILGDEAAAALTRINEVEMLDLAEAHGIIAAESRERYLPELDYMETHEPENSFRTTF